MIPSILPSRSSLWLILIFFPFFYSCQQNPGKQADAEQAEPTIDLRTQFFPKEQVLADNLPSKDNFWIFLMGGQSNMAGRGLIAPEDTIPHPRILTINSNNEWILAKEPLNVFEPRMRGLDCGLSFARKLLDSVADSITIGIIHCAVGGSSIQQWLGDSVHREVKLSSNLKEKAAFAQRFGTIKGILWHQGESDANTGAIPVYYDKLHQVMTEFRSSLGNDKLPIIMGELGSFAVPAVKQARRDTINEIIHRYADAHDHTYVIDTEDLTPKSDSTHFDAPSQRIMGARYAEIYLKDILPEEIY